MAQENIDAAIGQVNLMTDEDLNRFVDFIRGELKDQARTRNRIAKSKIKVDDRVKLAGSYKPAYLMGLTGVVTEIRQTRVVVTLDVGPVGKFKSGKVVTNPSGLTVIPR